MSTFTSLDSVNPHAHRDPNTVYVVLDQVAAVEPSAHEANGAHFKALKLVFSSGESALVADSEENRKRPGGVA